MKTKIHPVFAALVIIVVVCAAGYWMWSANQDVPIPDKFMPPSVERQLEQGGAGGKGPAPAAKSDKKGTGTAKAGEKATAPAKP